MVKKVASFIASMLLMTAFPVAAMTGNAFLVEQIQAEMPNITLYVNSENEISKDNIEVMLDYSPIEVVSAEKFAQTDTRLNYYILIDDSGSVSDAQINSIKNLLVSFGNAIDIDDSITLISIGTLETLYSGTGVNEEFFSSVETITNNKQETFLYEALDSVNKTIASLGNENEARNVIIAFSDGLNEAVGKTSYAEIGETLRQSGIPLYAMGIKGSDNTNLEAFGELARSTGGDIVSFEPEECASSFATINDRIQNSYKIELKASNNIISGERVLLVKVPEENFSQEYKINPVKWIPDSVAPEITAFEMISANQFEITFSEPVSNADNVKNYLISRDGKAVVLKSVTYTEKDNVCSARITTEISIVTGEYEASAVNITDKSNEKNSVDNKITGKFKGEPEETNIIKVHDDSVDAIWIIIPIALVIIGVIVAVVVIIVRNGGVVTVDGKVMLGNKVKVKHYIRSENAEVRRINMCIVGENGNNKEIQVKLVKSLTVGRAQHNDVYFDDVNMSRYHYIIENKDGKIYIKDNESMGGTYLNGVKIGNDSVELCSGDIVNAGKTQMIFRW